MVIMNLFHTLCLGRRLPAKRISPGCVTAPDSSWYNSIHVLVATHRQRESNQQADAQANLALVQRLHDDELKRFLDSGLLEARWVRK